MTFRDRLKLWFGLRCVLWCCPGEIITPGPGLTFWRCSKCGAQAR